MKSAIFCKLLFVVGLMQVASFCNASLMAQLKSLFTKSDQANEQREKLKKEIVPFLSQVIPHNDILPVLFSYLKLLDVSVYQSLPLDYKESIASVLPIDANQWLTLCQGGTSSYRLKSDAENKISVESDQTFGNVPAAALLRPNEERIVYIKKHGDIVLCDSQGKRLYSGDKNQEEAKKIASQVQLKNGVHNAIAISNGDVLMSYYTASNNRFRLYFGNVGRNWKQLSFLGGTQDALFTLSGQRAAIISQNEQGATCNILRAQGDEYKRMKEWKLPSYSQELAQWVMCELLGDKLAIGGTTGKVDVWDLKEDAKNIVPLDTLKLTDQNQERDCALVHMEQVGGNLLLIHRTGIELWDLETKKLCSKIALDPAAIKINKAFRLDDNRFLIELQKKGRYQWNRSTEIWTFQNRPSNVEECFIKSH